MLRDCYRVYDHDVEYLKEEGIILEDGLNDLKHGEEQYIGEIKTIRGGSIKIWVLAMPAKFWRFEIISEKGGEITTIETGSGKVRDYLPTAKLIMEGMVVVTKNKAKKKKY